MVLAGDGDGTASWQTISSLAAPNLGPDDISAAHADHAHGNLTNAGLVGTTSGLPLKTGTGGIVEAGAFGTTAGTFAQGNDTRLSDSRTPTAHAASHAAGGSDPLAPSDIGAQSIFVTEDLGTITANVTLTAARAKIYTVTVNTFNTPTPFVELPTTGIMAGDVVQIRFTTFTGRQMPIRRDGIFFGSDMLNGERRTYIAASTAANSWNNAGVDTHTHAASDITSGTIAHERGGLEADVSAYSGLVKIFSGSTSAVTVTSAGEALLDDVDAAAQRTTLGLGTAATSATGDFAAASHSHGNINSSGQVGSTSGLPLVTTTAGAVTTLALGTAGQILRTKSDLSGVEFADPSGGGVTGAAASASDVLGVSGANITGVDAGSDKIVFWDDSASELTYLTVGSGLSLTDTTLTATATGGGSTNLWIPASQWIPRTTNGCGVDSRETSTNLQNFDELLFDAGTDEFAQALVEMPSNYNNGTITARFYWTASSGSGAVIWGIQGRAFADDDALDTTAGSPQTVTDTLLAANDMHISAATSAVTIGGTPAANTPIQFQIYRDADPAGDTLGVDARLLGVEIIFN